MRAITGTAGAGGNMPARRAGPERPEAPIAFDDFVRARSAALLRTALLLAGGRGRPEAEDLLQTALERAYRHWGRICRSGDPERYVRRVLANASVDWWRRLRRRPEQALSGEEPGPPAVDHADTIAQRDFLLRALAGLPPRQRAVLVLRYFCDMSEAEIADALGCTTGTVKSQASRGLARLRELSQPADGSDARSEGERPGGTAPQAPPGQDIVHGGYGGVRR
jgi:RNA polymerase sigma-70 factor (sigma-E family)